MVYVPDFVYKMVISAETCSKLNVLVDVCDGTMWSDF